MISYLQRTAQSPIGAAIKRRATELLAISPGERVIDVGCGPGTDTLGYAPLVGPTGVVVGVDGDAKMVSHACALAEQQGVAGWTHHLLASATALPYADGSFDAWHSERLLQHLPMGQPLLALVEARRVLRPGGRAVVVDTDWGSLSIACDVPELERRIARVHADRLASGYSGRQLARLVHQADMVRTATESFSVPLSPEGLDLVLAGTEHVALATGRLTTQEWCTWRRALNEYRSSGDAIAHVVMVAVLAQRS
jgi:ubiquinone/menaquinone biosynthesis C-methylase UbiE